jgi:uncharacterized BrkB/YihY/UPF0761 family membrane protein
LPTGSATAVEYVRSKAFHLVGVLITTSLLTLWTASSAIVSWMEGFRKAYRLPQTWGLVKERLIASSLVILAGVPLTFATILIAFGSQMENRPRSVYEPQMGPIASARVDGNEMVYGHSDEHCRHCAHLPQRSSA